MNVKDAVMEVYDESLEKALPSEFMEDYDVIECLKSSDECYTLLVVNKQTEEKFIAKCYSKDSLLFEVTEPESMSNIKSEAIPDYAGEYRSEEYRCVLREYVEGVSLYDYVRRRHPDEAEIADIALKLAEAMKKLHGMEPAVIHRDIKPQNIIVKDDGSIVLIDLGISRIYKENENEDTVLAGTQFFAAPEQYGFRQTDVRSDIYSYGVVLTWMLTGKPEAIKQPGTMLEKIACRCCEFTPEKRYKNDDALLAQLKKTMPEHKKRNEIRKNLRINAAVFLVGILVGILCHMAASEWNIYGEKYVRFKEPLIEQAVRVMLDKPSGKITESELGKVTGIYIHGNKISTSSNEFFQDAQQWENGARIHGDISDISDLTMMPNLNEVCIGGQHIKDISPLKEIEYLEMAEFRRNYISDISPLENKKYLFHMGFSYNKLESIDVVSTCPALICIDLRNGGSFDCRPIMDVDMLDVLDIAECYGDIGNYLDGKHIDILKPAMKGMTNLDCIRGMTWIKELYIDWSDINDISALEGRDDIKYLNMKDCMIDDVSPLFSMPALEKVDISGKNRDKIEKYIKENGADYAFEIVYD